MAEGHWSGKRNRIMVACVTFEVAKIVDPVEFYEVSKVHLVNYEKGVASGRNYYGEFKQAVIDGIRRINPSIEVVTHGNYPVTDFTAMLKTMLRILHEESGKDPECEIFVNITVGPSGYAAASTIASMMVDNAIPFIVGTDEYNMSTEEEVLATYYDGDTPVGLTRTTKKPFAIKKYRITIPDPVLIRALWVMGTRMKERKKVTNTVMIDILKDMGIWMREEPDHEDPAKAKNANAVFYQRNYVDRWLENGWITKDYMTKKYVVTKEGETVLETFSGGEIFFD